MKKNYLLKSLFLVIGLTMGYVSAWASETATATVHMNYVDYSNSSTASGEIATGSTAKTGYNKISGGSVGFGNTEWNFNYITYIQVDASAIDGTITAATLSLDGSGSTDGKRVSAIGIGYNNSTWTSDLTYATADKSITTVGAMGYSSSKSATTFSTLSFDITNALVNDADKIVTLLVYATNGAGTYIKNPSVTITYTPASATTANYAIKYTKSDGTTEIKTPVTRTGAVGESISLTSEDKATFYNTGNTEKYVYNSDNASATTIASDGSSVVTVKFDTYAPYTYTLNAEYGTGGDTENLSTGSQDGDLTTTVYYPMCKLHNGTYYTIDANTSEPSYGSNFSSSSTSKTLTYTAAPDISYFAEFESIGTNLYGTYNASTSSSGNSQIFQGKNNVGYGYITTAMNTTTDGFYDVYVRCFNRYKDAETTADLFVGDNTTATATVTATGSAFTTAVVKGVYIPAGKELKLANNTTSNSYFAGDYILVKPTPSQSVTMTSAGYSSFCSDYALDFSSVTGLTAYVASSYANNYFTLTQVDNAPAGTPLILKATAGSYTIPVTSSATAPAANVLTAVTNDAGFAVTANNIYVLANKNNSVGFYHVSSSSNITIPKGKAYYALASEAKPNNIGFHIDGETTGINDVNTVSDSTDNSFYTIQGLRVQKPVKGLYIHNNQKIIIK